MNRHDPAHQALIMLLGAQSRRRPCGHGSGSAAAMRAQTRNEGRYPGGRPPYGYRLVEAGPHPNASHARWGRRLHRLQPDPSTAPYVWWMFAHASPDEASPLSPAPSTTPTSPAHHASTPAATATAAQRHGRSGPSQRSWPTPATPADKYGTGNTPTTNPPTTPPDQADRTALEHHHRLGDLHPPQPRRAGQRERLHRRTTHPDPANRQRRHHEDLPTRPGLLLRSMRTTPGRPLGQQPTGYRCRHGHTSAQAGTGKAKNLYLREDHALHHIANDLGRRRGSGRAQCPPAVGCRSRRLGECWR